MTFQAAPNGIEVAFNYAVNTVPITNVFHVDAGHSPTDGDLANVGDAFAGWWDTTLHALLSTSAVPVSVVVTDISMEGGHQYVTVTFAQATGDQAAGANVNNLAAILTWRTAQIGRSYRGRSYIAGVPVDAITSDRLESTPAAAFQDAGESLLVIITALSMDLCVMSRWHNKALRSTAVLTPITSVLCRLYLGTQRRRIEP